jgi:predicted nucleic acid-binding protein
MSDAPLRCVVDASVGIKLFVADPLSDRADALFAHLAADPPAQFYVPDLFYIECANILWKYVRWAGYSVVKAHKDLEHLDELALRSVPTADLTTSALSIAAKHNVTAYDACYVALAQRMESPFVTADAKLARALAQADYDVHWLGKFLAPPLSST